MRRVLLLSVIFGLLLIVPASVAAQTRYATCDLCGFCPPNPPPSTWESCRACLYPNASSNPNDRQTVVINEEYNLPPTPAPGRWYTIAGCISSNMGGFQNQGGAAGVIQALLNLVFALAGALSLGYIVYGSFVVLTSQADPERLNYGKRVIVGAMVGLLFAFASVFITNLIGSRILGAPGFDSTVP